MLSSADRIVSDAQRATKHASFDQSVRAGRIQSQDTQASVDDDAFDDLQDLDTQNTGNFFRAGKLVNWSDNDRMRLQNIDDLHARMLEYHNNVHSREVDLDNPLNSHPTESFGVRQGLSLFNKENLAALNPLASDVGQSEAIIYVFFPTEKVLQPPCSVQYQDMSMFLDRDMPDMLGECVKPDGKRGGLLWIRIIDPVVLADLVERLDIHELCAAGFSDLRAFSSFIPLPDCLFVSFCNFVLTGTEVHMYKLFVYISKNVVLTFEREIMQNLLVEYNPYGMETCSPIIMNRYKKIHKMCAKIGGVYLLSCLALQSLALQDTLIDYFSRTLFHFKQKVTTRQYHRDKLIVAREMHTVGVAVIMIKKTVQHSEDSFVRLLSAAMSGVYLEAAEYDSESNAAETAKLKSAPRVPLLAPLALLIPEHTPYLLDLVDSYKFASHLLSTELEEVQALTGAMDALTTLRSINTSTLLSFVATVFLPLNFLTGIFGTNFINPETQSYYIDLLNQDSGPGVFGIMCAVSAVIITLYFVYNGWVDFRIDWRRFFSYLTCGLLSYQEGSHYVENPDQAPRSGAGSKAGSANFGSR
jgi:hypothetical protein